jgi:hypothetical protein
VARIVIHYAQARRESQQDAVRFVRKVLHEIRFIARLSVSHGPYTTGRLAQSIRARGPFISPGSRVRGEVGSDLAHASIVEGGARPHLIFPIPPRTHMKFYWRRVGRVVYPEKVRHPGQRGKGYLAEAARTAGRRYNLRVIIYP